MYKCEECNIEFKTFQAKANHRRWKHLGYVFKNETTKQKNKKHFENGWKVFTVKCCKCEKEFEIKEYDVNSPKKEKYYCSRSCANGHTRTKESKEKISKIIKEKIKNGESVGFVKKGSTIKLPFHCKWCGVEITFGKKRKFCSKECKHEYQTKDYSSYQKYKLACLFKFSLNDFPEEFDFSLIEKYGWYKAKNRGNNLYGISRDHMFSIKEGFLQNINPELIGHPANCKLMRHNENSSKYKKCSITLEELQIRIKKWNEKYGPCSVIG